MLITRAEKQTFADAVVSSYEELEKQLMLNIINHIKQYDKPIDSDDWLMEELAIIGKLNQENIKTIARATKSINSDIEKMCNEVADRVMTRMEAMLPADQLHIVDKHSVRQTKDAGRSEAVERTVNTLYKQAVQSMNLTNTTMLYKSRDSFKEIVNNVIDHALQINGKSEYTDILSKHARSQLIGAESMTQAVREAIKDFNNKGIPAFVDRAGRNWSPEAYVSMNMRTTAGKVATESMMARMDDLDLKLVYVSSHSGARPKCAPYQGKVFDKHNGRGTVEDLNGRKIRYEPWSSTSYGEPDGLLGINCGHHVIPFIPGVSRARWEPTEDLRENRAEYEKMQHQRALERDIRRDKRLCDMYRANNDKDGLALAKESLREKQAAISRFTRKNELVRRKDREQVPGAGRVVLEPVKGVLKTGSVSVIEKARKNLRTDSEQFERYKNVLGDLVPKTLEDFQNMKYNEIKTWNRAKHNYRIVNSYEANAGTMTPAHILKYDQEAFDTKKLFTGNAKRHGANIAVMELDGKTYFANSKASKKDDKYFVNFKGDKSQLALHKEKRRFKTMMIGHNRDVDTEAKLFEAAADIVSDGKPHTLYMLSEKCMCDSCLGVKDQFMKAFPNVSVNVVSNKRERNERNHGRPWGYRR